MDTAAGGQGALWRGCRIFKSFQGTLEAPRKAGKVIYPLDEILIRGSPRFNTFSVCHLLDRARLPCAYPSTDLLAQRQWSATSALARRNLDPSWMH
jgi:hypothetical protein